MNASKEQFRTVATIGGIVFMLFICRSSQSVSLKKRPFQNATTRSTLKIPSLVLCVQSLDYNPLTKIIKIIIVSLKTVVIYVTECKVIQMKPKYKAKLKLSANYGPNTSPIFQLVFFTRCQFQVHKSHHLQKKSTSLIMGCTLLKTMSFMKYLIVLAFQHMQTSCE